MIKYRLTNPFEETEVVVLLDVDDSEGIAEIVYEGDRTLVQQVRTWLSGASGAFGHVIGDRVTPIDLDAAMKSEEAKVFSPELIEGAELLGTYDPEIPEDTVT